MLKFLTFPPRKAKLKDIFKRNGYSSNFMDICDKKFLARLFMEKGIFALASKKELICVLPLL